MSLSYCGWNKEPVFGGTAGIKASGCDAQGHAKFNSSPESQLFNGFLQFLVFLLGPKPLAYVGPDLVPSFTAVFVCAARQQDCNVIPIFDTALVAHCHIWTRR